METGPRLRVSLERLVEPGIKLGTLVQGMWFIHYIMVVLGQLGLSQHGLVYFQSVQLHNMIYMALIDFPYLANKAIFVFLTLN